mgnify:CR=1 FL=1
MSVAELGVFQGWPLTGVASGREAEQLVIGFVVVCWDYSAVAGEKSSKLHGASGRWWDGRF